MTDYACTYCGSARRTARGSCVCGKVGYLVAIPLRKYVAPVKVPTVRPGFYSLTVLATFIAICGFIVADGLIANAERVDTKRNLWYPPSIRVVQSKQTWWSCMRNGYVGLCQTGESKP